MNYQNAQEGSTSLLTIEESLRVIGELKYHEFKKRNEVRQSEKLLGLRQILLDKNEVYTADDAANASRLLMHGDINAAKRRIRSVELRLGLIIVNPIDHINAGLIASICLIVIITSLAVPASHNLAYAVLGGGIGGLCYVTLQLIPDRAHIRGPQDLLHVLWRTAGAALFGIIVYGFQASHIIRIDASDAGLDWGLFAISAMSGFIGKLATDFVGALRK